MYKLNVVKIITEDSFRGIGKKYNSINTQQTVIGGNDIFEISNKMRLKCYRIGKIKIKNAFVLYDSNEIFYIYVNPKYKNYRKLFLRFIDNIPINYHIDHVLAKNLALYLEYEYVLICMLPGIVNSDHGKIERIKINKEFIYKVPTLCFMDDRIYNKILTRKPTARQNMNDIKEGYNPHSRPNYGLTLKQKGMWNSAFGFNKSKVKHLFSNNILIEIKDLP